MTEIYTMNFTEICEPVGHLSANARAVGTYNTTWMSMANHQRATFLISVGDMGQGATLDFAVQQATAAAGTGAKALTPAKAITQLTAAGGDGDDLIAVELRTEELDVDGGFDYIRGVLTIAGDACDVAVIPFRHVANYPPVATTAWEEIVT